jgi:hypothetical protein
MKRNCVSCFLRRSIGVAFAGAWLVAAWPLLACGDSGAEPAEDEMSGDGVAADAMSPATHAARARKRHVVEDPPSPPDAAGSGDPCDGVSRQGQCDGAVAVRCTGAGEGPRRVVRIDCGIVGLACGVGRGRSVACTGARSARNGSD